MENLYQTTEAPQVQFGQTGLPVGGPWDSASLMKVAGCTPLHRKRSALGAIRVAEAARIWNSFMAGETKPHLMMEAMAQMPSDDLAYQRLNRMAPHIFHEAMTRSDFLNLTTYVLDRLMLENYQQFPFVHKQIAKIHPNVRDFRQVERWVTDGGERPWYQVGEMEGFNRGKVDTSKYNYSVAKFEGGDQISWEAVVNDDMDMFKDLSRRLAYGGGRTPEIFFTKLVADVNGPHAAFYTGGNKNIIDTTPFGGTINPKLDAGGLMGVLALLMNLQTTEGRGIDPGQSIKVMVGDGFLYQTLMNIINTNQLATTIIGGSKSVAGTVVPADVTLQVRNWIAGRITPIFNPELRGVVTAGGGVNVGRSWWVFLDGAARPAVEVGYLTGYEAPAMFRKLPDTVSIGGGAAVDELGSYEYMATEFKGLIVFGGTREDPKATMASNGSGV